MNQHEAIFEAPAAHEAHPYVSGEGEAAHEFEWETHEASHYSPEASQEDEADPFLGNVLGAVGSALGLGEEEWESPESVGEADPFFGKAFRAIRGIARGLAPIARAIAPKAIRALAGMVPGVGPILGQVAGALLREAAHESASMEAALFSPGAAESEHAEAAHEAALTEALAAEAAAAESEAEAEAILAGTLPITITIMGGHRALRPVLPTLAQANARLVRVIRREGPAGRQLLRTVPSIQRRAIAVMRAAARRGMPITGALATRALASAAGSILSSPRHVGAVLERNAVLRRRAAPPSARRLVVYAPGRVAPPSPRRDAYRLAR